MAKKWKEVLSDSKLYGDDFVVTLKDGETLSLGEMRQYDRDHEGELTQRLTAREKELEKREGMLNTASVEVGKLIERTAASVGLSVDDLISGKTPTKKQVAAATELDDNDPLVGTVVKELKKLQAKADAQEATIQSLRKDALGPMLNTYLEDWYEAKWEKVSTTLPKSAKVERSEAMEYATKNGLKDSKGRLDLAKAARDLSYDARVQEEATKIAGDIRRKDDDARALAAAPRPSQLGQRVKTDKTLLNDKGRTKDFDEVLNDALQDTDLWRGITQTQ